MLLSQLMVQESKRETFEQVVTERILKPLQMDTTGVGLTRENQAVPHDARLLRTSWWDMPKTMAGVGGVRSSARDMLRYAMANMKSADDSPYAFARKMQWEGDGRQSGLAWQIRKTKSGKTILWHNGGTGGSRAFLGIDIDNQRAVVVLSNSENDVADDLGMHLLDPELPLKVFQKLAQFDEAFMQKLVGEYLAEGETKPGLFLIRPGSGQATPFLARLENGAPIRLEQISDNRFAGANGNFQLEVQPIVEGVPIKMVLTQTQGTETRKRTFLHADEKPAILLSLAQLQPLAGIYRTQNGQEFAVSIEGGALLVSANGGRPVQMSAMSATEFFKRNLNARVRFEKPADSFATSLEWTQMGGASAMARRVE